MVLWLPIVIAGLTAAGLVALVAPGIASSIATAIGTFLQNVFSLFQSFVQAAPTPMKVLIFLFMILTIGNIFSNFILGATYACDSANTLYKADNIGTTMGLSLTQGFLEMSESARNEYIQTNFEQITPPSGATTVRCVDTQPKLLFFSVNVLSYTLWLFLCLALWGIPMILKYYSAMGVIGH
jgi:hypothetical protein